MNAAELDAELTRRFNGVDGPLRAWFWLINGDPVVEPDEHNWQPPEGAKRLHYRTVCFGARGTGRDVEEDIAARSLSFILGQKAAGQLIWRRRPTTEEYDLNDAFDATGQEVKSAAPLMATRIYMRLVFTHCAGFLSNKEEGALTPLIEGVVHGNQLDRRRGEETRCPTCGARRQEGADHPRQDAGFRS